MTAYIRPMYHPAGAGGSVLPAKESGSLPSLATGGASRDHIFNKEDALSSNTTSAPPSSDGRALRLQAFCDAPGPFGEVVNPSDQYTIDCSDREAAAAVVMLITGGSYAIRCGEFETPLFLFGNDPSKWWTETFGGDLGDWFKANRERMARAASTMFIGEDVDRKLVAGAVRGGNEAALDEWHNAKRTSMSDAGSKFWKNAETWFAAARTEGAAQDA